MSRVQEFKKRERVASRPSSGRDRRVMVDNGGRLLGFINPIRPIGGLRMVDNGEADDKIIAVINGDPLMGSWKVMRG